MANRSPSRVEFGGFLQRIGPRGFDCCELAPCLLSAISVAFPLSKCGWDCFCYQIVNIKLPIKVQFDKLSCTRFMIGFRHQTNLRCRNVSA